MSAKDDDTFGSENVSGDMMTLPAFFTGGHVDDKKYEDLLADLRAHDLLGPDDGLNEETFGKKGDDGTDNLPSFFQKEQRKMATGSVSAPPGFSSAPPGFTSAPPGLGDQIDLEWSQGQEKFNQLHEAYAGEFYNDLGFTSSNLSGFGGGMSFGFDSSIAYPGVNLDLDDDSSSIYDMDETQLANFYSLGLDDDEASVVSFGKSPAKRRSPRSQVGSPQKISGAVSPGIPIHETPGMLTLEDIEEQYSSKSHIPQPPPPLPRGPPMEQQQYPPPGNNYPPPPLPLPPSWRPGMAVPRGYPPMQYGRGVVAPPQRSFLPGMTTRGYPTLQGQHRPRQPLIRTFHMMTPRDIQFVVQQQMKQLRSSDPFSDDYYYHNYMQKKNRQSNRSPAPLPSWKLQHVKSIDPRDISKANKSREWESENKVLGRNDKTSIYCPRAALKLTSSTGDGQENEKESPVKSTDEPESNEKIRVFNNSCWDNRYNVEKGMRCLLSLQDARHLLDARGINPQQFHQQDISTMDVSLVQLRSTTAELLIELASILGVSTSSNHSTCDVAVLNAILSSMKGMRLVCRALPLLHPSARFVILKPLMELLVSPQWEHIHTELVERLCQTLVIILIYHPPVPPPSCLADCLEAIMKFQDFQSLSDLLHHKPRAELLQALLQQGGVSCAVAEEPVNSKWSKWEKCFVDLASQIKSASLQEKY